MRRMRYVISAMTWLTDFTEPVSEEDADDMLGFLATFLNYVYQMPAAIRRRQEARKNRRANPNV